jgi:DNA-binding transcriptional LysR family regulator
MDLYPKISVDLFVANQVPDMVEQRIDVGIAGGSPPTNCFARRITDINPVICASKSYVARNGRPKRFEDLAKHRCINVRHPITGVAVPWIFGQRKKLVHLDFTPSLAVNDGDAILQVLLNDGGIGMLPTYQVASHVRSGSLEVIFPSLKMPDDQGIHVFLPQIKHVPRKSRVFSDFIFNEIRRNPDVASLNT